MQFTVTSDGWNKKYQDVLMSTGHVLTERDPFIFSQSSDEGRACPYQVQHTPTPIEVNLDDIPLFNIRSALNCMNRTAHLQP